MYPFLVTVLVPAGVFELVIFFTEKVENKKKIEKCRPCRVPPYVLAAKNVLLLYTINIHLLQQYMEVME